MADPNLKVNTLISGLNQPTSMAFLGPNDFLVLEKATGRVQHVMNGSIVGTPLDLAVNSASERLAGNCITAQLYEYPWRLSLLDGEQYWRR